MSKKPVTSGNQEAGDISFLFRTQNPRTLDEIDILLQRKEKMREKLGNEKANEIDKQPELFYDSERFNIMMKKARFRAFVATIPTTMAISTFLNGSRDGLGLIKRHWYIAVPAIASTYCVFFTIFHRQVGYSN